MLILKRYYLFTFFLLLLSISAKAQEINRFIIYYTDKAPELSFSNYSLIVFDSEHHPEFQALKEEGKVILAHISVGEIKKKSWYFEKFKKEKILIKENPNKPESYYIDIRNKKWIKFIIGELVPWILEKRFNGIFIDTLDNSIELEKSDPIKFQGMTESAVHLIQAIRHNYPQIKIMLNKTYELIPRLNSSINYILGSGIYTNYNFKTKKYFFVNKDKYQEQVNKLHSYMANYPKLKIFTLDYWYPNKGNTIKNIYKKELENNFIPYVSDIELNKVIPEPK